jgi:hypothetical protein
VETLTQAELGAVGYYLGEVAQTKNIVIDGLPKDLSFEKLKYLLSPMPVSGAVSMCHIVGITPEAPDVDTAFKSRRPDMEITIRHQDITQASDLLSDYESTNLDVVMLGCPHLTINELKEISRLLCGKKISDKLRLFLATNEGVYNLGKRMGYIDDITRAGGLVITDSCIAVFPFAKMRSPVTHVATNSARCAHYLLRGGAGEIVGGKVMQTFYGSTTQCIHAAIQGKWGGK